MSNDPKHTKSAYLDAVLSGKFSEASALYELLPHKIRRVELPRLEPQVTLELKCSLWDYVLSQMSAEGPKGSWTVSVYDRRVLLGFDDSILLVDDITDAEKELLRHYELLA